MDKIFVGLSVASAAAVAAGSAMFFAPATPDVVATRRLSDPLPVSFGVRFPDSSDFKVQTAAVEPRSWTSTFSAFSQAPQLSSPPVASDAGPTITAPKVPLPKSRPLVSRLTASLAPMASADTNSQSSDPLSVVSDKVRKVFAMLEPANKTFASAAPDGGISIDGHDASTEMAEQHVALYDIAGRTVYMPDGTKLEAHSGFGDLLDDPLHVDVHDRGATPPQVYELYPREKLFHGIEALRMKPVGDGALFGRSGLLTHSYMLGPNGDSNGCVSFKDYDAFLKAYKNGDVKRLIVVPNLADTTIASAHKV